MKYVVICGGTISSIGKGKTAAILGNLFQRVGYNVTYLKLDPYLNYGAGNMSPIEHGESYVLEDGSEVDMDLGSFERMCNVNLSELNSCSGGKILYNLISREKNMDEVNTRTIQFRSSFARETMQRIRDVKNSKVVNKETGEKYDADIMIIELGGCITDMEATSIVNALDRYFSEDGINKNDFCFISLDLLLRINEEQKTRLIQQSIISFKTYGITIDILIYRYEGEELILPYREKISRNCGIGVNSIFGIPSCDSDRDLLQKYLKSGIYEAIAKKLELSLPAPSYPINFGSQSYLLKKFEKEIKIGVISRFRQVEDCYHSLMDLIGICGKKCSREVKFVFLNPKNVNQAISEINSLNGVIFPNGLSFDELDGKMKILKQVRECKIPFLGIGKGFESAILELANNLVLEEETRNPLSQDTLLKRIKIKCKNTGKYGMFGSYPITLGKNLSEIYGTTEIISKFRIRYYLDTTCRLFSKLKDQGMEFECTLGENPEFYAFKLLTNNFYYGVAYSPEFTSTPSNLDPMLMAFITASVDFIRK